MKRHIEVMLIIEAAASYSSPFFVETWPNLSGAAYRYCDLATRKYDLLLWLNLFGLFIDMLRDRNRVLPISRALLGLSKNCCPTHAGCIITSIAHPNRTFRGKKLYPRLPTAEKQLKDPQAIHMSELLEAAH